MIQLRGQVIAAENAQTHTPDFSSISWEPGDVALAFYNTQDDPGTLTAPAGWTQIWQSGSSAGVDGRAALFVKTLEVGEDETPTFNRGQGGLFCVLLLSIWANAVEPSAWVDDDTYNVAGSGGTSSLASGPVVTPEDNCMVVGHMGRQLGEGAGVPPTGYTKDSVERTGTFSTAMAYKEIATAGTETPGAWSDSGTGRMWSSSAVLLPSSGGIVVGVATESEAAQPVASVPGGIVVAVGAAGEIEASESVMTGTSRFVVAVTEAEAAQPIDVVSGLSVTVGSATEIESSQEFFFGIAPVAVAQETEIAQVITPAILQSIAVDLAGEVEVAGVITVPSGVEFAGWGIPAGIA